MTAADLAVYAVCGLAFLISGAVYSLLEWRAVCRYVADLEEGLGQ